MGGRTGCPPHGAWGVGPIGPSLQGGPQEHQPTTIYLQSDDAALDEKIVSAHKMKATADAHCIGSAAAARRFSSILGTPEPKPQS